ncbi:MAG: alkaline phosphatase [candidate division NC10 bacterium]|nr:alkaline phosphatase [candidate division NC10 bacterium]
MRSQHRTRSLVILFVVGLLLLPIGVFAGQAKNIILMIGDGMGPSQFGAAWLYSNRVLGKELQMVEVMKRGRTAYLVNDTADAIVTESAAAAGQIATGEKMTARALSMAADGKTPVKTILEIARDKGMATGLVTTSGITDATPAAFASHVAHRSDEASVAEQELQAGVVVLLGGRKQFFLSEAAAGRRKDGRNLLDEARAAGYAVIDSADELKRIEGGKVLGLFNMGNMAYEIDRATTAEPSLAEMTAKTLQVLSQNSKGFFAMIEGGRIDHAAHRNDAAGAIRDTLAFDQAVGVVLEFQQKNPDTLVIVTADHETGGMALIGNSKDSKDYVGIDLAAIQNVQASFEVVEGALGKNPTPEKVREVVKTYLAIEITDDEAKTVITDPIRKLDPYNYTYPMMHSLAFVLRPYLRVGWGSQTHTASPLLAFGSGPGSETLVGFRHNTDLFRIMKAALE